MTKSGVAVHRPKSWLNQFDWLVGAALYFATAVTMIHVTTNGREIAAVWVANAVLVGLLAAQERPKWLSVIFSALVANAFANMLTRGDFAAPMFFGLANMVEIAIATWLLRAFVGSASVLSSLAVFIRFSLIGFFASTISGLLGAFAAWHLLGEVFLASWMAWTLSDALGLLVFVPFFLALFRGDYVKCIQEKSPLERLETAALLILTLGAAWILFFVLREAPIFILLVPTMLVTIRIGQLGTKAAVMLIAAVGISSTFLKTGLIYRANDYDGQILILQIFLFVLLFSSLPVAADLTARRSAVAALGRREQELKQIATTDSLTGLMNRPAFVEFAEGLLSRLQNRHVCLVAIDVDHFKRFNDTFGHHVGDDALRHLASVARAHLRSGDVLSRVGGDEFMLLLPDAKIADAQRICARLGDHLRRAPLRLEDGTALMISVSCGIAAAEKTDSFTELSRRADTALYDAKDAGRGTHRSAFESRSQLRTAFG